MTNETPEVKRFPGVRQVKGSTVWHYWKRNPDTLMNHPAIGGRQWAFRASLGTSDLREANAKAAAKLAELEAYWSTLRASQRATAPAEVTPALADAIAQRVKAAVLADDERLRGDPEALAESLSQWWTTQERARKMAHDKALRDAQTEAEEPAPYWPKTVPQWLTQDGREELRDYVKAGQGGAVLGDLLGILKERHEAAAKQARQALGKGNTGPFLVLAEREALALGVNLGADAWVSPEAKPLRDACQRAYLEALEGLALRDDGEVVDTPLSPVTVNESTKAPQAAPAEATGPTLGEVVKAFIAGCEANDYTRKLTTVTTLLVLVLGADTPVKDIKQAQLSAFMSKVCKLPVDWYARSKKGESVVSMLDQEHPKCIAPSTFAYTYRACVASFLKRAKAEYHDQGFPMGLSVDYAKYQGTREENEEQQRNFKAPELVRLFGSREYAELAKAPDMAHRYWLPLLMLYSGARPREICQINPQVDYGVEGDIPFLLISDKTPADDGVTKTVKTGEERHIPIHPELVRLGFLVYLDKIKGQGAKRLFPGFGMHKGDAAARAKSWFSDYLEELGLRDETPKALISGLYAFRKTFITAAHIKGLKFEPITGHADKDRSKVTLDSYIMEEIPLKDKLEAIRQVVFPVSPPALAY